MNRLCIFAHFDLDNVVDQYVLKYLQELRSVAQHLVFVSTSTLSDQHIAAVRHLCDSVITRENAGYDFMSWQTGLASVRNLAPYDELIICNDSVYGPFYPLENVFDGMATQPYDFWGITSYGHTSFHLQSYFIVFKKHVIESSAFRKFWHSITPEESKARVVDKYEIGLTETFVTEGFRPGTYVQYRPSFVKYLSVLGRPWNLEKFLWFFVVAPLSGVVPRWKNMAPPPRKMILLTHAYWKELIIHHKMPFIKIELLKSNPTRVSVQGYERVLEKYSSYDVTLIKDHLKRMEQDTMGSGSSISGK
jgi:lipopolysaccharide biosynthesis protein